MLKPEKNKGKAILRPRARLIKTIGEELISNDIVAIIELIKNSYDANASVIELKFEGRVVEILEGKTKKRVFIKNDSILSISDDGCGMNFETVRKAWMEPATIMKKNVKMSPGERRRYTGEKGIGRFATAKLAGNLKMITKVEEDNEVVVDFNWSDFSKDDKYLDQVECDWEIRDPLVIKKTGTVLVLNNLNTDWDEDKFRELRVALSRLINPVSPISDFLMYINLPTELNDYAGYIEAPDSLNKPDYVISGNIDKDFIPEIIFLSKKEGIPKKLKNDILKLRNPIRKPLAGPFQFEFRVWDRDTDSLKKIAREIGSTLKNIKNDLNDLAGISIYRDKFRVLPYGEKKNDWLRLDIRRVNNPTMRLSNNQIVGYISISLDDNLQLKDQSNREGIVESQAFTDLKELILLILNELEIRRYEERPRENEEIQSQEGLFNAFTIAPVVDLIKNKHPDDKEILDVAHRVEANILNGVKKIQVVLSRYRRLSTLGLLIDVILHDGNNFLARIDSEVHLLTKDIKKRDIDILSIRNHIDQINEGRNVLAQLFKRLEPFGGRKRGRPKEIILEESISNIFALYENELKKLYIHSVLPNSKNIVKIDESEFQIIIVNLLQNSIYWLETVSDERKIIVEVEKTQNELSIVFSDSGPGISDNIQKLIFDPYFSTKPDGIGLGLTIVGELVTEYDGEFLLIDDGPLNGASFKIIFRRRI
jgi:signal transduction histidine kinase